MNYITLNSAKHNFNFKKLLQQNYSNKRLLGVSRLSIFMILLIAYNLFFSLHAQSQTSKNVITLASICEPEGELEFFVIRKDLNINKEEFLSSYLKVLELTPNSEMRFIRSETNDIGVTMHRYQQYLNNRLVKGCEMIINEQNKRVKYISGRYLQQAPLNSDVAITEEVALQTALNQVVSKDYLWKYPESEAAYKKFKKDENATYKPKVELMYMAASLDMREIKDFKLVWRIAVHVNPQIQSTEIFIDATTGEIVNKIPLTYECSGGTSTTLWNGAQTIYTQLNAGSYRTLSDCNTAQVHTYNGNGNDNGVGATYYTDADNAWPNTALGKYIAQTHWGNKETRDYYFAIHGRNGYDDAGADYITYINPGYTGNAYWTGSGTSFGGSSTGADPYVTLDVCGHEHTHGVIDFTSNLTYSYESGALNESFADCIGEAVETYAIGPTNWIHRHEIGGGNRSLINPNAEGDPDTYLGTNWYVGAADAGGVHTNSGVQNYWFYLLSEGGSGTNDNGVAFTVTGIGINKARLIAYDCMVALVAGSQYTNARSTSIQKAKDRYGDCSNEAEQTTRAWRAVGVGAAYVAPAPLTISVSTTAADICPGGTATVTAFGATTYAWDPGTSTGQIVNFSPTSTTTYTVTGTNAEQCTGSKTFTIVVNSVPTVEPTINDNELCPDQSTTLSAGTNQTINSLLTTLTTNNGSSANVFDVTAYNSITITDFKMNITSGDSATVWYNPGGYGNVDVITTTGWTKLGATVPITAMGAGSLTVIPTTVNLTIPAGQTYGIIVSCNGSNSYLNGTLVGSIFESNPDLAIKEGHGGTAWGSTFNLINSPRVFSGTIEYRSNYTSYAWTPSATLTSPSSSSTTASPTSSTTYTLTATDGNGCTNTGIVKAYVYAKPTITNVIATPSAICSGETSQLNVTNSLNINSQNLFTTLIGGNGNGGNMFDIHALNAITITNVRMNILSGDSAEVYYKTTPYGNANVSSSAGWTKLGNTVAITPAGSGALTLIPTSANLVVPAGSTYGFAVVVNGSNNYTNGTSVGAIAYSSPDIEITEGHGGTGFGGTFNFINSPRVFNGQIDYTVTNTITNYSWTPNGGSLSNSTIQNPVADPYFNTTYTVTLTDIHGCKDTAYKMLYVNKLAALTTTVSPNSICPGDSAQLNVTANVNERDSLFTTLADDNANGGIAFDIITSKAIIVRSFKMNIDTGATQVEVWYNPGGYGNANFTGTVGWTKLGATVNITPAGAGNLTNIPITTSLSIASGQTYGFMIVSNGSVNYTNSGSAVGTVYTSNPDISVTVGHGGTGIGFYSFANAQRIWNGEVTYDAVNAITGYVWTPNTNMNNAFISNPKTAPLSTTIYSVTATDINGCTSAVSAAVNVSPLPTLGTATATPSSLCLGANVSLAYTAPAGLSCFGAIQSGFAGTYAPSNWSLTQSPVTALGSVNTASAPNSISLLSSNGASGSSTTSYTITIPCNGVISFNWSYTTLDGPQYDYPKYSINGAAGIIFPGYIAQSGAPEVQSGVFNLAVTAGQTFSFQAYSSDNLGGACTITISSFKAPYQTTSGQSVVWFSAASGGSNLGNGNPQLHTPASSNTFTYYAQVSSSVTGCTNTSRVATNSVVVNPVPTVGTTTTAATICEGSATSISGTGAATYTWQPGGLTGTTINVSPTTTTTYTVTGTNSQGCTATALRTITVNPAPVITGSASPGIVCPGGSVTLNGTTAGVTWNWQPGNLNGSPVIVNPVAQTTYTVTATSAAGCTKTQTFVILMNPVPTVSTSVVPVSGTFCAGQSATITASSATATGYTWQPGGGVGANLIVTLANTYTVTATNSQGCTATATRVITVNSLPTIGTTTTAATICEGSSTSITGTGASTYSWQPGGLTGTTINVSPTTTTTYTVTGTNANGCTATALRTITVNPAPVITGSASPGIVCPGGAVTLTGTTAGVTWNWQPGNLNGSPVIVNPVAQTTYTVTATSAAGCTKTQTFVILMNPVPTVSTSVVPVSGTFCAGQSATITASSATATGYTWQPGGGVGANLIVTLANTYTVTATNAQGCTATATRVITVNSLPTVGSTATSTTICSGTSTTINGTGAVSYIYNPGALSGSSVVVSPAATTTYTIIGTNANGCTNTATRLITVLTSPTVGTTVTSASIPCGGSTTITGTGASTYTWQPGALSGISINVSPLTTTTYTVTGTASNGCTKTATRTITVAPCGTAVSIKLYIEGYYLGAGMMTPVMQNEGVAGATGTQTDTITVEIRNTTAPYAIVASTKTVLNTNGTASVAFAAGGTYYLAIKHRNGVQTWSSTPITLSGAPITYDFSNALNKAYGNNQVALGGGVFGFYSGDINADENVDLLDFSLLDVDINNFAFGYFATDVNGDGNVDLLDAPIVETNIINFIFSNHP